MEGPEVIQALLGLEQFSTVKPMRRWSRRSQQHFFSGSEVVLLYAAFAQ